MKVREALGGTRGVGTAGSTRRTLSHWFWGGFFVVVLVGLVLAGFAGLQSGSRQVQQLIDDGNHSKPLVDLVSVILTGGERIYLDAGKLAELRADLRRDLAAERVQVEQRLRDNATRAVALAFAPAYGRIPAFAEWYYSLRGEYMRLWYGILRELPSYLEDRLSELVLGPSGVVEKIERLPEQLRGFASEEAQGLASKLEEDLTARLRKLSANSDELHVEVSGEWDMQRVSAAFDEAVALGPADFTRQALATSAGIVTGAALTKKMGAATLAKTGTKLATMLGLKLGAKAGAGAGSAATGAAAGAAICAVSVAGAPLAPVCALAGGVVTGVGVWILVDEAVLKADEYFNRAEFEQALSHSLAEYQTELAEELAKPHLQLVAVVFDRLASALDAAIRPIKAPPKDFVPADPAASRGSHGGKPMP